MEIMLETVQEALHLMLPLIVDIDMISDVLESAYGKIHGKQFWFNIYLLKVRHWKNKKLKYTNLQHHCLRKT